MHTPAQEFTRESKIVLVLLVLAATVMLLNETTLSIALPFIMDDFNVTAATAQWLTTGFILVLAVVIPTTGYLIERFSTRAIFFAAFALFIAGTLVAAIAPSFAVLLLGRVLQAAGTALVMPLLMTTVMLVVPPQKLGSVMGLIPVVIALAPAMGPTISGAILNVSTWHTIFWSMLPISIVMVLVGAKYMVNVGLGSTKRLDILSIPLAALGFGGVVYALSSIDAIVTGHGGLALLAGGIGVVALVLFTLRQLALVKHNQALLDVRVFTQPNFALSVAVLMLLFGAFLGIVTVLPIYLQNSLGLSSLTAGLVAMPAGVVQAVSSPFVGRLFDRHGVRPLALPGGALAIAAAGGMAWASHADLAQPAVVFGALFGVLALGAALVFTPMMTGALSVLPRELSSHGSATFSTLQQLGGAAGIAVLVAVLQNFLSKASGASEAQLAVATSDGTSAALGTATGICVAATVLVALVKPVKAAGEHIEQGAQPQAH
ncbi:DHA2 family efflux MFS transporter permease subunit [Corynebacterium sp. 153RC1]|uniref:DHA2 family efflux MFS transporter permease subunit n=1 Tax=unclassified Corynebacterium TaxID=2624378 RepID=UPI00211B7BBC|nr:MULTISPECIES: DHA2 family efflux MFS transporter permease subunit [unclassified Corynebacterium]MCQ9353364.1 DHA2 family efflux MFS transporter permease subunit [Corynebacterium sp. 209RC1]MCQ9355535.1 DHA2 family efflux MFS transporter permease subunit [Corynebacterium sp. 1222RC1]MCQ9357672.1 DHA2 family efflux MFS transporter permease subunit [Corynebacterium sp. 122RC1]MCQ9359879.1 DHA2 family efflux MFS transporter permease subunit [Corynebacterium sp. 142RC1]MCQ9362008.1 DHA2 family e